MSRGGGFTDDDSRLLDALSIGCMRPKRSRDASLRALAAMSPDHAADAFARHKIRQAAHAAMEVEPGLSAHAAALAPLVEMVREVIADRPHGEACVDAYAREHGIRALRIKGLAMIDRYPPGTPRDIGDLDIHVEDVDAAWGLAQSLREGDFEYRREELPWLKRRGEDGRVYGQVQVQRPLANAVSLIDIHFGCYSVRHAFHLDVPMSGSPGLATLDATSNVPLFVANMAGDHFVTVKDVNDWLLLLGDDDIDWDSARRALDAAGLGGFFNILLRKLVELCDLDSAELRKVESLVMRAPSEPIPPWTFPDWGQRRRATAMHAIRMGRRQSLRGALRLGLGAARYYRRPLELRLERFARPPRLGAQRLSSDRCWRLVPADLAAGLAPELSANGVDAPTTRPLAGPLQVLETPAGDLVECAGEIYVPTVMYNLPRPLVARAAALANSA